MGVSISTFSMMQTYNALYLFILLAVPLACHSEELENAERDHKLISTFQIVRFPNDGCVGSNTRNGTCYTSAECSDKNGASAGSCADGFGVCCTFLMDTCDQSSNENITYWTQPSAGAVAGTCSLTVCPVTDDICQLRLDFTTFVITGPSTLTLSQTRRRYGQPIGNFADAAGVLMSSNYATNCLLDEFMVQGASPSSTPPIVCGTLTGTHMYVEADADRCNLMQFNMADNAVATTLANTRGLATLATRTWDITVSQIECTSITLPNNGCTQYFWGSATVTVASYNFFSTLGTSVHLANQHQRICIRRERGMCIGCFYTTAALFNVSGSIARSVNYAFVSGCCGYASEIGANMATDANANLSGMGTAITTQFGWDCIIIPGAFGPSNAGAIETAQTVAKIQQTLHGSPTANMVPTPYPPQICGNEAGIGTGSDTLVNAANWGDDDGSAVNTTICTRHTPFTLEFMSDDLEGMGSTLGNTEFHSATQEINNGFQLTHSQISC